MTTYVYGVMDEDAAATAITQLNKIQWLACLGIARTMRTTPIELLNGRCVGMGQYYRSVCRSVCGRQVFFDETRLHDFNVFIYQKSWGANHGADKL